jgi:hypothetical protein
MMVFACCLIAADASLLLAGLIGIVYILHAKAYEESIHRLPKTWWRSSGCAGSMTSRTGGATQTTWS